MKMHWTALVVGLVIGLGAGYFSAKGMGGNPAGITGGFARPFQPGVRYPGA